MLINISGRARYADLDILALRRKLRKPDGYGAFVFLMPHYSLRGVRNPPLFSLAPSATSAVLRLSDHGHRSRLSRICIRLRCGRDPTQRTSRRRDYLSARVEPGGGGGGGAGAAGHLGCLSKSPQSRAAHIASPNRFIWGPFTRGSGPEWSPAYAIRLWTSQKERSLKIWISRSFWPYLGIKEVIYWKLWRIARPPDRSGRWNSGRMPFVRGSYTQRNVSIWFSVGCLHENMYVCLS